MGCKLEGRRKFEVAESEATITQRVKLSWELLKGPYCSGKSYNVNQELSALEDQAKLTKKGSRNASLKKRG